MEPIEFISDRFEEIKARNPGYSLRAWAKSLGMKSHGPLHAILKKQRKIPKNLIIPLIKTLKLDKEEAKYFELLVDLSRAKKPEEIDFYKDKLAKLSPVPLREIHDLEAYKYLTDPIHFTVAEMTQLKEFNDSPAWMKKSLRVNQNMRELEVIIERLRNLGIVQRKKKNHYEKPLQHLYTKLEVTSEVVQNYHKFCSELAIDQVSKQDISEKEFNALCFNIKKKDLPQIKEQIRDFINRLVEENEAPAHEGDETYQLNVQFFSLTK
ncbi:MAG: hypothetical protein CME65_15780 [Halobacteriovoraceae bacterium]|nr:hypothetical protein [Halobacteriovoraceae bacterium]|tara:strand:- start:45754 stop:46551 length:798 start_codon:yes stop_codon:yes gene_type:complete